MPEPQFKHSGEEKLPFNKIWTRLTRRKRPAESRPGGVYLHIYVLELICDI